MLIAGKQNIIVYGTFKILYFCPGWCSSFGWVSSYKTKGQGLHFRSGHMPGLWVLSSVRVCTRGSPLMFLSHIAVSLPLSFLKKDFTDLFLGRGEGREKGRKTTMCGCLSRTPCWGPGLQPRLVPCLGIHLETFWFSGHHQSTEPHQPGLSPSLYSSRPSPESIKGNKIKNKRFYIIGENR